MSDFWEDLYDYDGNGELDLIEQVLMEDDLYSTPEEDPISTPSFYSADSNVGDLDDDTDSDLIYEETDVAPIFDDADSDFDCNTDEEEFDPFVSEYPDEIYERIQASLEKLSEALSNIKITVTTDSAENS